MDPLDLVERLEAEAASLKGDRTRALDLLRRTEQALEEAEDCCVIDRLELLLMGLMEATKENICTNTRCPHYSRRCRMR